MKILRNDRPSETVSQMWSCFPWSPHPATVKQSLLVLLLRERYDGIYTSFLNTHTRTCTLSLETPSFLVKCLSGDVGCRYTANESVHEVGSVCQCPDHSIFSLTDGCLVINPAGLSRTHMHAMLLFAKRTLQHLPSLSVVMGRVIFLLCSPSWPKAEPAQQMWPLEIHSENKPKTQFIQFSLFCKGTHWANQYCFFNFAPKR